MTKLFVSTARISFRILSKQDSVDRADIGLLFSYLANKKAQGLSPSLLTVSGPTKVVPCTKQYGMAPVVLYKARRISAQNPKTPNARADTKRPVAKRKAQG